MFKVCVIPSQSTENRSLVLEIARCEWFSKNPLSEGINMAEAESFNLASKIVTSNLLPDGKLADLTDCEIIHAIH
jgi:hypothetical protein